MRKSIVLGLLALTIGVLGAPAFAGNIEDCEYLKDKSHADYAPGLYGLCVAWHNADEDARVDLGEKFEERAGFPVPGSGANCPCWDLAYLVAATADMVGIFCGIGDQFDMAIYTGPLKTLNPIAGLLPASPFEGTGCAIGWSGPVLVFDGVENAVPIPTTSAQDKACSDQLIEAMKATYFIFECGQDDF